MQPRSRDCQGRCRDCRRPGVAPGNGRCWMAVLVRRLLRHPFSSPSSSAAPRPSSSTVPVVVCSASRCPRPFVIPARPVGRAQPPRPSAAPVGRLHLLRPSAAPGRRARPCPHQSVATRRCKIRSTFQNKIKTCMKNKTYQRAANQRPLPLALRCPSRQSQTKKWLNRAWKKEKERRLTPSSLMHRRPARATGRHHRRMSSSFIAK